jgi:class 3 adenylate cyclase
MRRGELVPQRTLIWHFDLPPERLWPVLADTNRFNEAMGLPTYTLEETPQPNGTVLRRGKGKAAGFVLEWEEKPYEWIARRHFRQARIFSKGPFRTFGPIFDLEAEGSGSKVTYTLAWEPLTLVGKLFGERLAKQAGGAVERRILEAVSFLKGERPTFFDLPPPTLPEGARERAAVLAQVIDRSPYGNGLGGKLSEFVLTGMATDLAHIKPKALARQLGVKERAAIEACLAGVDAGLLTMRWELLCSNCRGPKFGTAVMSELPRGAHCASCNIDYERDFERNVELSCAPAATIRPITDGSFCLSGPMSTPHVEAQIVLAPGERRAIEFDPPPGLYRLRTLHPGRHADVDHRGGPFPGLRVTATGVEALPPAATGRIQFNNDADFEVAAVIEDRSWTEDALTAAEVVTLQAFRDLFSAATLRPGDEAGISQVALLFSDLRGSTALYERVGDARAYNIVRDHFAFLGGIIREHDGAIVKTIGDAVMASFGDPVDAVKAALAMQARIADFNKAQGDAAGEELAIKLGVHAGASVMVNLNDRLDYFGSTVNMAARLQGQSEGGDIVISGDVATDPAVRIALAGHRASVESVPLKGFISPVSFLRVLPGAGSG